MKENTEIVATMGELNRMLLEIIHSSKEMVAENKAILSKD